MKFKSIKTLPGTVLLALTAFLTIALLPIILANAGADPTQQPPIQSVSDNGVTVSLVSVKVESSRMESTICIDLPDNGDWLPYAHVEVEKERVPADVVALANAKNPETYQSSHRCYEFGFPADVPSGVGDVKIIIEKIETTLPEFLTEEMCIQAEKGIQADYPAFAFTCNIGKQGIGFSISSKPKDMTNDRANQLIIEALTDTVDGPWEIIYSLK